MRTTLVGCLLLCVGCTTHSQLKRWYGEALESERAGSTKESGELYRRILETDPKTEGALNNLSVLHARDGKLETALKGVRDELKRRPGLEAARINEVLLLLATSDHARAERKALGLVGSFPENAQAHYLSGLVLARDEGKSARAEKAFSRAIELSNARGKAAAHFARGVLRARGNAALEKSAADFKATSELRRDAVAHYNRAVVLGRLSRFSDAIADLSVSASLDPGHAAVPHLAGIMHYRLKQWTAARKSVKKAAELDRKRRGLGLLLGVLELQARDYGAAEKALRGELSAWPKSPAAQYNLGLALMRQDDLKGAHGAFTAAAKLDAGDKRAAKNRDALARILE